MANNIYTAGVQSMLNSSSTGPGSWYRVHPQVRNITFQATITGSSVGVTVSSTIYVEGSNDGSNAVGTKLATIALSGGSPQSDGFTLDAHWEYVRFNTNSISTGSIAGIASPHFVSGG